MKNLRLEFAAGIACCLLLAGCGTTTKFVYPDRMSALAVVSPAPLCDKRVAVLPFEDFRSDSNETSTMSLFYVPGFPYGYTECERPENGSRFVTIDGFQFTPTEDLAKAATVSLKRSNIFSEVFFTFGGDKGNVDLTLEGSIVSTYYKGRLFSYCTSIYCCYLWVFGAPYGTSLNRLSLKLDLKNKAGKVLWTHSFEKDDYLVQWLYARRGQDTKFYAPLMREAMNEAVSDLANQIRTNPNLLNQ